MMTDNLGREDIYDLMADCNCPRCRSYTVCARLREQRFFCMKGKSPTNCVHDELGCACPDCPVGAELGKGMVYYCRYDRSVE